MGYDGDEPNRVNVSLMIASGKRKWLLQKVGGSGQDSHDFDGENVFNTGVDYYMELTKDGALSTIE